MRPLFEKARVAVTTGIKAVDNYVQEHVFPTANELAMLQEQCLAGHPTPSVLRCLLQHVQTSAALNRFFIDPVEKTVHLEVRVAASGLASEAPPKDSGAFQSMNASLTDLANELGLAIDNRLTLHPQATIDATLHVELVIQLDGTASTPIAVAAAATPHVKIQQHVHALGDPFPDPGFGQAAVSNITFTLHQPQVNDSIPALGISTGATFSTITDQPSRALRSPKGLISPLEIFVPAPSSAWDTVMQDLTKAMTSILDTELHPLEIKQLITLGGSQWLKLPAVLRAALVQIRSSSQTHSCGSAAQVIGALLRSDFVDATVNPSAAVVVSIGRVDTDWELDISISSEQRIQAGLKMDNSPWLRALDTSRLQLSPLLQGSLDFVISLSGSTASLKSASFRLTGDVHTKAQRLPLNIGLLPASHMTADAALHIDMAATGLPNDASGRLGNLAASVNITLTLGMDVELAGFKDGLHARLGVVFDGQEKPDVTWSLPLPQAAASASFALDDLATHVANMVARVFKGGLNLALPGLQSGLGEMTSAFEDVASFAIEQLKILPQPGQALAALPKARLSEIRKLGMLTLNFTEGSTGPGQCVLDNGGTFLDYSSPSDFVASLNRRFNAEACGLAAFVVAKLDGTAAVAADDTFGISIYPRVRGGLSTFALKSHAQGAPSPAAFDLRIAYNAKNNRVPTTRTWEDLAQQLQGVLFSHIPFKLPQWTNISVAAHPELVPQELRPYWPDNVPGIRHKFHLNYGKGESSTLRPVTQWNGFDHAIKAEVHNVAASAGIEAHLDTDLLFALDLPPANTNVSMYSHLPGNDTVETAVVPEQNNTVSVRLGGVLREEKRDGNPPKVTPVQYTFALTLTPGANFAQDMCQKLMAALPDYLVSIVVCDTAARTVSWHNFKTIRLKTPPSLRAAQRVAAAEASEKKEVRIMAQREVLANGTLFVPQALAVTEVTLPYFKLSSVTPLRSKLMLDKLLLEASADARISVGSADVEVAVIEATASRLSAAVSCNMTVTLDQPESIATSVTQASHSASRITDELRVALGVSGRFYAGNLSLNIGSSEDLLTPDAHIALSTGGNFQVDKDFSISDLTASLARWNVTFVGSAKIQAFLKQLSQINLRSPCAIASAMLDSASAAGNNKAAAQPLPFISKAMGPLLHTHLGEGITDLTKAICSQDGVTLVTLCKTFSAVLGKPNICARATVTATTLTLPLQLCRSTRARLRR